MTFGMQQKYQKRIVFYIEPEWAFGNIHYELTKYLFEKGVNTTILPWTRDYTLQEISELGNYTDFIVSTPYGIDNLMKVFGIAPEKCIAMVHAVLDLQHLAKFSQDILDRFHKYAVVSDWLLLQNNKLGIGRTPEVVPIGINYNTFLATPSKELKSVGFAGAYFSGVHLDIKRSWLVEQVCRDTGLSLKIAQAYNNSFVTMPAFYNSVDAVIVASTEEGAGLPALEASASGKLVISTPVGLWKDLAGHSEHTVPIDQAEFVEKTTALLNFYKQHSDVYQLKCTQTQQHARLYDWSNVVDRWAELLS